MTVAPARAVVALLLVVLAACGGDPVVSPSPSVTLPPASVGPAAISTPDADATSSPGESIWPLPEPSDEPEVVHLDPETGEITAVEPLGPSTLGEVVDAGIAAGRWDELRGLDLVLGYAVGAVPAEQIPGIASVQARDLSELIERADAVVSSGDYSEEELTDLRRWIDIAVPGPDVVERLADSAPGSNGVALRRADAAPAVRYAYLNSAEALVAADHCTAVNPWFWTGWGSYEDCYVKYEDVVQGATLRVFYPSWFDADESMAGVPLRARTALLRSADTYSGLADSIGDISLIFSIAASSGKSAYGVAIRGRPGSCPITIFPSATGAYLESTVAHEVWHCVQDESGYPIPSPAQSDWYEEGGAEYFAYLVYPGPLDWLPQFDKKSITTSLFDMSYEAWVWWQFLGSRQSPKAIADLQLGIALAGDGGRAAMKDHDRLFHEFVVAYVAGKVPSPAGGMLPAATLWAAPLEEVTKSDADKEIEIEVDHFVAKRIWISYDKELQVLESDESQPGIDLGMAEGPQRTDLSKWREIYSEVRSTCNKKVFYTVVATTAERNKTAKIKVDEVNEAVCDPCLLGTWDLDLNSFKSMLSGAMGAGGMPAGSSFDLSGNYYIAFAEEGEFKEQRDGLTIRASFGGFSMNTVIDSFAHGTYSDDGENVTVSNLTDDYVRVSIGDFTSAQESRVLDGSAKYQCRADDLTLTIDSHQPLNWTRVDKILEPPPDA